MRKIALINQKGGVGKTTTVVNLGAALARLGSRVVVVDLDPQANLSLHLGLDVPAGGPSTYAVLVDNLPFGAAVRPTSTPGLSAVATNIDLSGAELELANAFGRETILRDALAAWEQERLGTEEEVDFVLFDCPPSLGLLSINGLAAADEVFLCVQTQFFALQGVSKLVEVVRLIQRRMHPDLSITGIVACLYDNRLRLAREVLGEVRRYFPGLVFPQTIGLNVKLAEAPSFGKTIFEYAPESSGAREYRALAEAVLAQGTAATDGTLPAPADAPDEPPAPGGEAEEPREADVEVRPFPSGTSGTRARVETD